MRAGRDGVTGNPRPLLSHPWAQDTIMPTCQDAIFLSRLLPADLQRGVQDVIEAQVSHRSRHCSRKGPPPTMAH